MTQSSSTSLDKKINKRKIVDASLELMNEVGLSDVTTRRLAEKIGIKSASLYWYFNTKQELLGEMREAVIRECLQSIDECSNLEDWLHSVIVEIRASLLLYRDSIQLLSVAPISDKFRKNLIPILGEPLMDAGADKQKAYEVITIIASFCMGWVAQEQSESLKGLISETIDLEGTFANGANILAKSLSQQVTKAGAC